MEGRSAAETEEAAKRAAAAREEATPDAFMIRLLALEFGCGKNWLQLMMETLLIAAGRLQADLRPGWCQEVLESSQNVPSQLRYR